MRSLDLEKALRDPDALQELEISEYRANEDITDRASANGHSNISANIRFTKSKESSPDSTIREPLSRGEAEVLK